MRLSEAGAALNALGRLLVFGLIITTQGSAQSVLLRQGLLDESKRSLKELAERVSPAGGEVKVLGYGVDDDRQESGDDNRRNLVKQRTSGAGVILDSK